jgi:hypothetical protein
VPMSLVPSNDAQDPFQQYLNQNLGGCPAVTHKPESCVSMALASCYHSKHRNHTAPVCNEHGWINKYKPTPKLMYPCCQQALILHVVSENNRLENIQLPRPVCPPAPRRHRRRTPRPQRTIVPRVLFPVNDEDDDE